MTVTPTADRPSTSTLALAGLALLVLLGCTAWARPLMLPDEGRYVCVAWEMMRSGNWATPTLNGLPFFHKPPLFYWITAAAMSVFGVHEWAARSAPLVGAWMASFGMFVFTWRWAGKQRAVQVGMVLLAQPLFFIGAQFANLDMLVAGCITVTILLAANAALNHAAEQPYQRSLLAAYAFAALGMLAKGLIGFVLPGLVIVVWMVLGGRWRALWALVSLPGILLFGVIAAPWFVVMQQRFPQFLDYFFMEQHFRRFTGGQFNNVQPWWFYVALLMLFHSLWLPWIAQTLRPSRLATLRTDPLRLLMGVWVVVIVGFFSLPQSKLVGYILPALPPLAYLLCDAFACRQGGHGKAWVRWWYGASALGLALSLSAIAYLTLYPVKSTRPLAQVLGAAKAPAEPVFMLDGYYYDVPFYARLRQATAVVHDWQAPDIDHIDNWRKELHDAARFASETDRGPLILPGQWTDPACAAPASWWIGPPDQRAKLPFLARAQEMYQSHDVVLWRLDHGQDGVTQALGCEGGRRAP